MSELKGPVILVDDDDIGLQNLKADFKAVGQQSLTTADNQSIAAICTDPLSQLVVVRAKNTPIDSPQQIDAVRKLCADYLVVVALDEADLHRATEFFRLGAADVLTAGESAKELKLTLARVDNLAETRRRADQYSTELEKTNVELQESLRLLKQDQLAGLEVQKSLMPESPLAFGDYEISHSITPSLYLSGDFVGYNFVLDRYLLFYFADVSGHGASSAFVTVLLRFMIGRVIRRPYARKRLCSPGPGARGAGRAY
jgi:ActR/RegA family two-component response regulator